MLIDPEKTLDQNLQAMHQKHPPRKRKRYGATLPMAVSVLKTKHLQPAQMLRPLEMLEATQVQTRVAQQIARDAALEGIPLVTDVEQQRWGLSNILVRHYDFGKDLSLNEIRVIQQLCKVAATKVDCELHFTLETLRFSVTEKPQKEDRALSDTEYRRAVDQYVKKCQTFAHHRKDFEDILSEWRYLKWPINCNCG